MDPSPFHGIFSAMRNGRGNEDALAFGLPREEQNAPPQPSGNATSPADGRVGKVAVDIFEQDDYYIIRAPIAGVRLVDLEIEVNDTVLTIRGNRRQSDAAPENQYYLRECFFGPFSRSITLPFVIDPRKVKATFNKDCILKILIPKEERVKIVRINEG
ncbi:Hsp20/alpha crystallin family protein [Candidatus Peregrinibacteria bacterium]|nr:Hsp20/alpha crystallin family protein [Candidatus Peregrinibacteria bacterium]MBI3816508.1 Hsp20/alpha crystallin family protein [Candidatus Peregrinibacteria bacterium]